MDSTIKSVEKWLGDCRSYIADLEASKGTDQYQFLGLRLAFERDRLRSLEDTLSRLHAASRA